MSDKLTQAERAVAEALGFAEGYQQNARHRRDFYPTLFDVAVRQQERIQELGELMWHAIHKGHQLSPSTCEHCAKIDKFMAEHVQALERMAEEGR